MSDQPALPVPAPSTISRVVEPPEAPTTASSNLPLFSTSLSGVQAFPAVPSPPGLADRP